ncbi:ABC transporter ATP-binding protein [uncultured Pontibacter sp.]|uniref:ABC transporter ATP-binding protein n=1 Tax=uncultured Pontibacter sp. TaxID=453356 RepID=UPI002638B461|nr:ABC transporter ATP-binding protein [uncultured Pontibacter sp.]
MEVKLNSVGKSFNSKVVLQDVSFTLKTGKAYALLGKNGAGKSTILNLIVQLLQPEKGSIGYDGVIYKDLPTELKRKVGFLSEQGNIIEDLDALNYLKLMALLYGLTPAESEDRINELLQYFFEDVPYKKRMASFSTGMKKKVALCAALVHKPDFLILDEPFTGLDPFSVKKVIELILQYQSPSRTVLIASHDLAHLSKVITDVLVIRDNSVVFDDTMDAFTDHQEVQFEDRYFEYLQTGKEQNSSLQWL